MMLNFLFLGMLKRTCDVYGDCLMHDLGLAPIALASPRIVVRPNYSEIGVDEAWAREFDR